MNKLYVFSEEVLEVLEETIELTTENSVKTAKVGSRIELECRSSLKPPVAYAWSRTKNNKGIPMGATIRGSTLILPNVNYQDAGIYVCKANNTECVILQNSNMYLAQRVQNIFIAKK